ncbi:MAG: ribosomal protein S18-alanine N-acetyltransferase [Defluviitaleaceae bacterium]|nr:ribosomal protein S18-alanine N-acetyltransferase [Defluviitaleaceae bacterium]
MIEIIKFEREHLNDVYAIEEDSFSIPWSKHELEKDAFENKLSIYLLALFEGEVAGYVGMWHVVNEGHITNIAVKKEYRGNGIGDKLIKQLINIAIEKEMIGITLEVRMNNAPAQKLYANNGFKIEGLRKNYYKDTKEDAIIMWRYL